MAVCERAPSAFRPGFKYFSRHDAKAPSSEICFFALASLINRHSWAVVIYEIGASVV